MVFEIQVHDLGAQKQISGGGTYNLIEAFGGEEVESTGFAYGFDRLIHALEKQSKGIPSEGPFKVFVAPISQDTKLDAFKIAQNLRRNGITTDVELAGKKLKKALAYAGSLGAKYVILVGARDLEEGKITLKDMTSGKQDLIDVNEIVPKLQHIKE
jgi:histidyl-tRNA synthetase